MRKRILLALCILFVCVTGQAQFVTQMNLLTPHYYPGEVYFTDGHYEAFDEIELPRVGKSKIGVKKNAEEKGHTDIEAIDIVGIKIWHKNFPDKEHVLYYVHAKKSYLQNDHQWGNPIYATAWGVLFQCEQNYQMDKKTGDLNFVKFVGGNGPDTPTLFYLKRPEWNEAQLIMINGVFIPKKKAAEFFKDNEQIYNGVKSGKLKADDIKYIMDEMAGGKPADESVLSIPEAQIDSVSNGVVGDDE
jgi:hypothetical protein